jgi:two-component system LytT family response regulator
MPDQRLGVVIVDHEPTAREKLRGYVEDRRELELLGDADEGVSAVDLIRRVAPHLVFLDVHLPGLDGFEVVAQLEPLESQPRVVLVTAYDRHAVRAFEVNAFDYLLKPVARERFDRTIDRCLESPAPLPRSSLIEDVTRLASERLVTRDRSVPLLPVSSVDRIESERDYVRGHAGDQSYLIEKTLSEMEALLFPRGFVRIHQRALVNVERIKELHVEASGCYRLQLVDGTELVVSRRYSDVFRKQLYGMLERIAPSRLADSRHHRVRRG